ncbi:MAG TPA: hypothetical protein ENN99_01395, partial [Chloroflexi bacterium]|nr:hypothetical protein [Chloroflexota bacterium]
FDYQIVNPEPPRRVPNAIRSFWVIDGPTGAHRQITARLRVQTEHVAMWMEEDVWHDVQALAEAAHYFETRIYSTTRTAFGSEWTPGVDNDPRIHVLHATGLGEDVLGYTSSTDEFPRAINPYSNQTELIVVHATDRLPIASPPYYALLARQFQRLIQWFQDRNEARWVKEGLAELAVRRNGFDLDQAVLTYLAHPDTSLTAWAWEEGETAQDLAAHRGAASLFTIYFHERWGDEGTRRLTSQPLDGPAGFDAVLADLGTDLTFEDLFADWLVANYLDAPPTQPGETDNSWYSYTTLNLDAPAPAAIYEHYPVTLESSVQPFGADYILLRGTDDLHIQFTGVTTTLPLSITSPSGRACWWSNRADESLTTLVRKFDLSGVAHNEPVTMTYWTWYDIELNYDYATVEISADEGRHWQALLPPPDQSYTGRSGGDSSIWIQEIIDLSPYAGSEVWIRFSYLTDGAITGVGFLLDDISIPRIGYADDVKAREAEDNGWQPAGFVRRGFPVEQRYLAILLLTGADHSFQVERLIVGEDGAAEWAVPLGSEEWSEAVILLSGVTRSATQPAHYRLAISTAVPN